MYFFSFFAILQSELQQKIKSQLVSYFLTSQAEHIYAQHHQFSICYVCRALTDSSPNTTKQLQYNQDRTTSVYWFSDTLTIFRGKGLGGQMAFGLSDYNCS